MCLRVFGCLHAYTLELLGFAYLHVVSTCVYKCLHA